MLRLNVEHGGRRVDRDPRRLGSGLNKQVAARLGVAEVTIKVHRHNIMKKMCVRSMVSLARIFEELAI